ncbi:tetratricopeptide repeat protein [bacterium]|nr:tetratricopeptide repeat protein [bacterium]
MRSTMTSLSIRRVLRVAIPILFVAVFAVACGKQTPDEQLAEAQQLLSERQTARGVIKLKELIRDNSDDPAAATGRLLLARYYTQEGNAQKALEQLQEVVDAYPLSDPNAEFALNGVLSIRLQIGDIEGALAQLDKAIEQAPDDQKSDWLLDKAAVLLQSVRMTEEPNPEATAKALEILNDLMLNSEDAQARGQAREQLADYYRSRGEFAKSNEVYEKYLAKYPDDKVRDHLELAMAVNLMKAGEEEKAHELFDPRIASMREAAESELDQQTQLQMLQDVARYYEAMGDLENAEAVKKELMGKVPMTKMAIDTQFDIAMMYARAGNTDRALEILEQIKEENPESQISEQADGLIQGIQRQLEALANPAPLEETPEVPMPGAGS